MVLAFLATAQAAPTSKPDLILPGDVQGTADIVAALRSLPVPAGHSKRNYAVVEPGNEKRNYAVVEPGSEKRNYAVVEPGKRMGCEAQVTYFIAATASLEALKEETFSATIMDPQIDRQKSEMGTMELHCHSLPRKHASTEARTLSLSRDVREPERTAGQRIRVWLVWQA
ncbi:hypothetical protein DM02DRAFT_631614 [Periconia macrospinosa]|uniref:Uncharacterized protein n=1 Tax=Periconia macrospinosa TaxID=97972 RepID=A0A2V1DFG0_9PLEO|nr:hypothetical protein DM02DRAFT_631614 [Periconia macrospinosa]